MAELEDLCLAVIADVHGNSWALEAVLEDVERRGIRELLNLGDSLFGPLDPAGTARVLRSWDPLSIRGNQDRAILEPGPAVRWSATQRFVMDALGPEDLEWLALHGPPGWAMDRRLFLCHGTPAKDDCYLAEEVGENGVRVRQPDELLPDLEGVEAEVILCGHSHVPRVVALPDGRLVVNPGSVGLPAYSDASPYPHAMESGSPHAQYAVLTQDDRGWHVEQIPVTYDWQLAAKSAGEQGRSDWAEWLRSGRATVLA